MQLEKAGGSVGVKDGEFPGVGSADAGEGIFVEVDGLDVLFGLEEDVGLLSDLFRGSLHFQLVFAFDGHQVLQ